MSGKCRPSLRYKTLWNVDLSNLSKVDKECIHGVFELAHRQKAEIDELTEAIKTTIARQETVQKTLEEMHQDVIAAETYALALKKQLAEKNAEIKRLKTLATLGNMRAHDYRVMRDRALKAEAEVERLRLENEELIYPRERATKDFEVRIRANLYCIPQHHFTLLEVEEAISKAKKDMVGEN